MERIYILDQFFYVEIDFSFSQSYLEEGVNFQSPRC